MIMMKDFVFDKEYDRYFLFFDNEIVNNDSFYERVRNFSIQNRGEEIIISLLNLQNIEIYKAKNIIRFSNRKSNAFDVLSQKKIDGNRTYEDLLFEFTISDDTQDWIIYCNIGNDIGLGACDNSLYHSFIKELKPYENLTFEQKMVELSSSFIDKNAKKIFLDNLLKNYRFAL